MHQNRFGAARIVALIVLVVAACSAATTTTTLNQSPAESNSADLHRLLNALSNVGRMTAHDFALINNSHSAVVTACMQEAGYAFESGSNSAAHHAALTAQLGTLVEAWVLDLKAVESASLDEGDALVEAVAIDAEVPDIQQWSRQERDAYWAVFAGHADDRLVVADDTGDRWRIAGGGCMGQAYRSLWDNPAENQALRIVAEEALASALEQTLASLRVQEAVQRWRACMLDNDVHSADTPLSVFAAQAVGRKTQLQPDEAFAADAQCKTESQLPQVFLTAFERAARDVSKLNENRLAVYWEQDLEAYHRAKEILARLR